MSMTLPAVLQPHVEELEPYDPDAQMEGRLRHALILMAILFFGFGGAAALIPIGGAVIGSGQIGVESNVKRITHPTGGTIAAILVKNGDHVRKGQVLIRLDNMVAQTDATYATLSVDQMLAQKARLEAEQIGASIISFPAELTRRSDPTAIKAMADERQMFAIRQSEQAGLRAQLEARIGQYQEQIAGYRAQIASLQKQAALIEPELKGVESLYGKNLVTLNRLNQLKRTAADLTGSIGALEAQIAGAQGHISETREQMIQMAQTRRSEAGNQIAQINTQLNQQTVRSVSASDVQDRTVIRAPYDGIVSKLAFSTIGGVIRPAEIIMEIVPDQDRLLVEGAVSPADVDQLVAGQPARVRLSALNNTSTPEIKGKLDYVGADRTTDPESGASFYPIRVEMDADDLARNSDVKLRPGMPAEVFVETGSRTMLSYVTKPLRDQIERAFRDN